MAFMTCSAAEGWGWRGKPGWKGLMGVGGCCGGWWAGRCG